MPRVRVRSRAPPQFQTAFARTVNTAQPVQGIQCPVLLRWPHSEWKGAIAQRGGLGLSEWSKMAGSGRIADLLHPIKPGY
jgi:hypothetical protein